MLKKRVIAVLILRYGEVVQSVQFRHTNVIHKDPRFAVEYFSKWDADELILLDVTRTDDARARFLDALERVSRSCFVPIAAGGWLRSSADIEAVLARGADKVVINSEAVRRPAFLEEASRRFGSQCIVLGVDCRRDPAGTAFVFTDRGREATGMQPVEWTRRAVEHGAGEIFLCSIDHDGMRGGYDLPLMREVASAVPVPVIAFGGASTAEHLAAGLREGGVDAVSAANVFHYSENSMRKMKRALLAMGLPVRR